MTERSSHLSKSIWVFHAAGARFSGGVFDDLSIAKAWILQNRLTGVLTAYPLNEGCFEWAVRMKCVGMKAEKLDVKKTDPGFVGGFTTAAQEHFHFEDGVEC